MKRRDVILSAMEEDMAAGSLHAILNKTKEKRSVRAGKIVLILAAAAAVLTVSVSAALVLSGFGAVFDVPLDVGCVEILDHASTNADLTWMLNEVWFDEYNLYVGGSVTTPDVLSADGRYLAVCSARAAGETEARTMIARLFPNGETTVPFILSWGPGEFHHEAGGVWTGHGYTADTITLELTIGALEDLSGLAPEGEAAAGELVVYPGEWHYTLKLTSTDTSGIYVDERHAGENDAGEPVAVAAVSLNPFTLEITGENLLDAKGEPYKICLRMKDGTLLGKESGVFAHTGNRFRFADWTEAYLLFCFEKPIALSAVDAVVLMENCATFPMGAEDVLLKEGWTYYVSPEDETRLEGWTTVLEVPLG